jgi:asparagine N-glycosylation enzyme membrane subunit Stt3
MFGIAATIIVAFLSLFLPGVLLSFGLLRKTELHTFEITVIGLIFGLIAPATMTWLEGYFMGYIHFFTFSLLLFEVNALVLIVIGAALCYQQGVLKDFFRFLSRLAGAKSVQGPAEAPKEEKSSWMWAVWSILLALMIMSFATRMFNIGTAPTFFEFDPYFDMLNTQSIITYGYEVLLSPSAWPAVPQGTVLRVEPLIPYIEAYWYSLANFLGPHYSTFNTNLMSYVGSFYPPIAAALLVFVVFLLLYHEYDARIGLIGAALTMMMPTLYTTFIAGEQLLEPWGIFALFFFLATYLLAVRHPKQRKLAVLAGIAFVSNFLGAHYYTVTAGILAAYILLQGVIDIIRKEKTKDFYILNAIVLAVIAISYLIYNPYSSSLADRIPNLFGIPTIVAFPLFSLAFVFVAELLSNRFSSRLYRSKRLTLGSFLVFTFFIPAAVILALLAMAKGIDKYLESISRASIVALLSFIMILLVFLTPIGAPVMSYLNLSARFTTPSKPLFMTVQEYIPTGLLYNFGAEGFGTIGADIIGLPLLVWLISISALALIVLSIIQRKSVTGILYLAIALPLMFAGFSEVKYLPHFGVAYIILFCIALGELMYLSQNGFKLNGGIQREEEGEQIKKGFYSEHKGTANLILVVSVFFLFGALVAALVILYLLIVSYSSSNEMNLKYIAALLFAIVIFAASLFGFASRAFVFGESSALIEGFSATYTFSTDPVHACAMMEKANNVLGESVFCNTVPAYWLNSMAWIKANLGPYAPRVLSWWDYGDWINWFGNSNAVLRGDNAVATEDYATAANLVLGSKYNYTPQQLAEYMNTNQSKYLLLDEDLISKWQALDFLACIHVNATSSAFAKAQGALQSPPTPYMLGNSQCELENDPQFALLPLSVFVQNLTQQSVDDYCTSISNNSSIYARGFEVVGDSVSNNTVCVNLNPNKEGALDVYNDTGAKTNAVIQSSFYEGVVNFGGVQYVEFLMIYLPGANGTVEDAPSGFYLSNYYDGFILGKLQGFTQVYPANAVGVNFVNGTYPVRIFALNNYTGGLPPVPAKPAWVHNNYTMP